MSFDELAALDAAHVMGTYARQPVAFVRGEGSRLWDSEGREYLDFLGGLAVTSLGHAHPEVADALAEQARTLLHVSNLYYNDVQPRLAAELDGLLGGGGRVFFSNSGAEANECAIKLARRYGQKHGIPHTYHVVSALNSFHGRTLTTLAAHRPAGQAGDVPAAPARLLAGPLRRHRRHSRPTRSGSKASWPPSSSKSVQGRGRRVAGAPRLPRSGAGPVRPHRSAAHPRRGPDRPRADGQVVRLRALRHPPRHRDHGQGAGQRRADRRLLGHRRRRPRPSNPATTPPPTGASRWPPGPRSRRSGSCSGRTCPSAPTRAGARLAAGLAATPGVSGVRGLGLLLAAELAPGIDSKTAAAACLEHGLIVNAVTPTALRFEPSLLVTDDEIDEALAIVGKALA